MNIKFITSAFPLVISICCLASLDISAEDASSPREDALLGIENKSTDSASTELANDKNKPVTDEKLETARDAVMKDATQIVSKFKQNEMPIQNRPNTPLNRLDEVDYLINNVINTMQEKGVVSSVEADEIRMRALSQSLEKNQAASADEFKVKTIRVPYVPEFVKQDIRDRVRTSLRSDVLQDVIGQAKHERWGIPQALPEWISRIKLKGDVRLRAQGDFFADNNADFTYPDYLKINEKRTIQNDDIFFKNTTIDRQRARIRARLSIKGQITQGLDAKLRLSTGNSSDPVSTNQSLGNYGERSENLWDRVYLQYTGIDLDGYNWVTAYSGRMKNPWVSTDLLWDKDLSFEGIASKFRFNLRGDEDLLEMSEEDRTLYFTVGAFTLQEEKLSSRDKWLFGAQAGVELLFDSQSKLTFSVSYYDFVNINGEINSLDDDDNDFTAPPFVQNGNTMVPIHRNSDPNSNEVIYALGGDYNILNLNLEYDIAQFSPYHVVLTADYVKNLAFDKDQIIEKYSVDTVYDKTNGYQIGVSVGWPIVKERGRWRLFTKMKYLEANAVLDAFTDSDFHGGGTDAKGFIIGGEYSVWDNSWFTLKWLSADEISGPPLGIDILQIDLNAQF